MIVNVQPNLCRLLFERAHRKDRMSDVRVRGTRTTFGTVEMHHVLLYSLGVRHQHCSSLSTHGNSVV